MPDSPLGLDRFLLTMMCEVELTILQIKLVIEFTSSFNQPEKSRFVARSGSADN